ncbi:MAG: TadE/TadG family type IV pilus assembly protein [Pseudomonadota bacterium]
MAQHLKTFFDNTKGNVAIIFAIVLVLIIGVSGAAVDYSNLNKSRADAQNMADAAALAGSKAKAADEDVEKAVLDSIAANRTSGLYFKSEEVKITQTAHAVKVDYYNVMPTTLMNVVGIHEMQLSVTSTVSASQEKYVDFYLLLDVSGSMGIGATAADRAILASTQNCVFACHTTGGGSSGATLRIDALKTATKNLINTVSENQTGMNHFRFGIYPFVREMVPLFNLSSDLNSARNAVDSLSTDAMTPYPYGSGGTMLETALQQMNSAVYSTGDGSSPSEAMSVVIFVTDGLTDDQTFNGSWSSPNPNNRIHALNSAACSPIKSRNILMMVLNVEYQYMDLSMPGVIEDGTQLIQTNAALPFVAPALQACASQGLYFRADVPSEINHAMQSMFAHLLDRVRIIK